MPVPVSRRVFATSVAAAVLPLGATTAMSEQRSRAPQQSVVRLSRGAFPAEKYAIVRDRLGRAQESLIPAIRALRGCQHYWAGVDPISNTMINVSVWATLDDAKQMETLAPMLALAGEFVALGVQFERPITNYETLWAL
jgi:hypothetical protein